MTDQPTFPELLASLTADGDAFILTDDGSKKKVTRVGLLQQLRAAVVEGMSGGGSSAFGPKTPVAVAASDLLDEIDRQAAEVLVAVTHRPVPYGTTESYVRAWAARTDEDQAFSVTVRQTIAMTAGKPEKMSTEQYTAQRAHELKMPMVYDDTEQHTAYTLLKRWVDRVEDYFNPPSSREITAACPNCKARHSKRVAGGAAAATTALSILRDEGGRATEARCAVCKLTWPPSMFVNLAKQVGAKSVSELTGEPDEEEPEPVDTDVYECDYCRQPSTGYVSMRRHYRGRHNTTPLGWESPTKPEPISTSTSTGDPES